MTASFPRAETPVSLTLPLCMKNTASAASPWEKTTSLLRYGRVVFPVSILVRKASGSKARATLLRMALLNRLQSTKPRGQRVGSSAQEPEVGSGGKVGVLERPEPEWLTATDT